MFGCLVVLVWTVFFFRFVKLVKFKPNSVFFGGVRVRVENEEKRNCHISETTVRRQHSGNLTQNFISRMCFF